jgi:hypothetical protein
MGKQTKNWQESPRPFREIAEAAARVTCSVNPQKPEPESLEVPGFRSELRLPGMTICPYLQVFCINPSFKNNEVMPGEEFGVESTEDGWVWDRKEKDPFQRSNW